MIQIIFIITLIFIFIILKNKINSLYILTLGKVDRVTQDLRELEEKKRYLKQENFRREKEVAETMNLYDLNLQICEFLEESKIFLSFKRGLKKFVNFEECLYFKNISSQNKLSDYKIIPLLNEIESYGYLAIKRITDEDKEILDILIAQFISALKRARLYNEVQKLAITDGLTKIFTRRYCLERLEEEVERLKGMNSSLAFFMVDIDNFKRFNDKYGHLVGDVVLKKVANIIKMDCREIDLIGRFGGEEFMVGLPMTDKTGALFVAERIRQSIESVHFKAFDESVHLTISIGVAIFPQNTDTVQGLIDKADFALYQAKKTGRNKVMLFEENRKSI